MAEEQTTVGTEERPLVIVLDGANDEPPYRRLDPRARWLMLAQALALALLQAVAIAVIAWVVAWIFDIDLSSNATRLLGVLALLIGLVIVASAELGWRHTLWRSDGEALDVVTGILGVEQTRVPLDRVQSIQAQAGIIGRVIGLSRVTVFTAAGSVQIPALRREDVVALEREVMRHVGHSL